MAQTSYNLQHPIGSEGQAVDPGNLVIISKENTTKELYSAVFTAANTEHYILTINGVDFDYTSDGSATATEIRDGLKVLIDAGTQPVKVTTLSTNGLYIESVDSQTSFTLVKGGTTPSNTVLALIQAIGQTLPFGRAVCWDDRGSANSCRLPRASGDVSSGVIWGVTFADVSLETVPSATSGLFINNSAVPIVHKGRVWVISDSAVTAVGAQAYIRYASGSQGSNLGGFNTGTDTSTCASLTGARFVSLCSAGGLVQLELNLAI